VYYGDLEKDLADGKETAIVFADMGFLKYFDKAGGREVGNDALKLAADLMERAIEETGLEATAYRYGGDEFTVKINGGPDEVAEFNAKLFELTKEAGAVPAGRAGNERGYYPTPLEFNYGATDSGQLTEALDLLEERGALKEGEREDLNRQAEIMTQIADKMIETQKAVQRFELLIRQLEDDRYWTEEGDEDYKQHADKLVEFSDKGIFGERGGRDKLKDWTERRRSGEDSLAIRQEIMVWVGEQIAGNREQGKEKQDLQEQLIEQMVRDAYRQQFEQFAEQERQAEQAAQQEAEDTAAAEQARREIDQL
jgi:GGDEF domain-containing protein